MTNPQIITLKNMDIKGVKMKWVEDPLRGGTKQSVTIAFRMDDIPMTIQNELSAQDFIDGFANVTIELLQQSFYRGADRETGEMALDTE